MKRGSAEIETPPFHTHPVSSERSEEYPKRKRIRKDPAVAEGPLGPHCLSLPLPVRWAEKKWAQCFPLLLFVVLVFPFPPPPLPPRVDS